MLLSACRRVLDALGGARVGRVLDASGGARSICWATLEELASVLGRGGGARGCWGFLGWAVWAFGASGLLGLVGSRSWAAAAPGVRP